MQMVLSGGFLNHVESFEKPSAVVSLLSQFNQRESMGYFLKENEVKLRHKLHYYLRMQVITQYLSVKLVMQTSLALPLT